MGDGTLKQARIAKNPPPYWTDYGDPIDRTLERDVENPGLVFMYTRGDSDDKYDLNLRVHDHPCTIILRLGASVPNWFWSKKLDAITTKVDMCMIYGDLQYLNSSGVFIDREDDDTEEYKVIKFKARPNGYIQDGQPRTHHASCSHGFSLNIDLRQPNNELLPITLDPDIKNPPIGPSGLLDDQYLYAE